MKIAECDDLYLIRNYINPAIDDFSVIETREKVLWNNGLNVMSGTYLLIDIITN
jgi:hypothetical protein